MLASKRLASWRLEVPKKNERGAWALAFCGSEFPKSLDLTHLRNVRVRPHKRGGNEELGRRRPRLVSDMTLISEQRDGGQGKEERGLIEEEGADSAWSTRVGTRGRTV